MNETEQVVQVGKSFFDQGFEVFIIPALWAILLVIVVGLLVSAFSRNVVSTEHGFDKKKTTVDGQRARLAAIVLLAGVLVISSLVVTPPGHRGVIYTPGGVNLQERNEGYSLMVPLVWSANMVNVREQKYQNLEVYAQTYDGLEVTAQIGVNYLIRPDQAADIFQSVGQEYQSTIIEPAVLGLVKREIGLIEAEKLFYQRGDVETAIFNSLETRLDEVGIDLTFVALQDTIFDPKIVEAFRNKEAARQKIIEEERLAEAAKHERDRIVTLADADAQSKLLVGNAQIEIAEGLADALTLEVVQYQLALQGIRWLPDTLVTSAADILLGIDSETGSLTPPKTTTTTTTTSSSPPNNSGP